jgi:hypothetical protein
VLTIILIVVALATLLLLALGHERRNRALKHRAGTQHLLTYIAWLPCEIALARNLEARWQD